MPSISCTQFATPSTKLHGKSLMSSTSLAFILSDICFLKIYTLPVSKIGNTTPHSSKQSLIRTHQEEIVEIVREHYLLWNQGRNNLGEGILTQHMQIYPAKRQPLQSAQRTTIPSWETESPLGTIG